MGKTKYRNEDWLNLTDEHPRVKSYFSTTFFKDCPTCASFQEAIQLDGEILFALLRRVSPPAFRHLEKHKIDPILYMTEWFMCAFSRTLPWASVLRVWDMFLCDGAYLQWCQAHPRYTEICSSASSSFRSEDNLSCGLGAA